MRLYAREPEISEKSTLLDRLRIETSQSIASIRLMLEGWIEPSLSLRQNLSTLLHQTLALIIERGGISYQDLLQVLTGPGPFSQIETKTIRALLLAMGETDPPLIEQSSDGTLMLGKLGEQITDGYEFFAVFKSTDEFRIIAGGKTLGTVSIINSFGPGDYVVFAGQRWRVVSVDDRGRAVHVEDAPAGRAPMFEGGEPAPLHDRFVEEIRAIYVDTESPIFLDAVASQHLLEGRNEFHKAGINTHCIVRSESSIYLFPWRGTATLDALRLALKRAGIIADQSAVTLRIDAEQADALALILKDLAASNNIDGAELAELDQNLERSKYDRFVPRTILKQAAARDRLNAEALPEVARILLENAA